MNNSMIIADIKSRYNSSSYYNSGDFISINDDRMSRIVSFKIYEYNDQLFADFKETHQISSLTQSRSSKKNIKSTLDFQMKYYEFYNDL